MTPTAEPQVNLQQTVTQAPPAHQPPSHSDLADRFKAKLTTAAQTPTPAPVQQEAPKPEPPAVEKPAEVVQAEPADQARPASVDDVDLDAPQPEVQPTVAQPIVAEQPVDPQARIAQIASDLGITAEALTASPAGRKLLAAQRMVEAMEAPMDKGGIGYRPSVEEIHQTFRAAMAMDGLEFELVSNPQNALVWALTTEYNPQAGRVQYRPNALQYIDSIPQTLERMNPQLYNRLATPFVKRVADLLYQGADSDANGQQRSKEEKDQILQAARIVESSFLGTDRTRRTRETPEMVQQRQELEAERKRITSQNESTMTQRSDNFRGQVFTETWAALNRNVDTILAAMKQTLPDYGREHLIQEAIDRATGNSERGIQPANPLLFERFQHSFELHAHAARTNPGLSGKQLSEQFRRIVEPSLRAVAKQVLQSHIEKAQTDNGSAHAQAQAAASRVEPLGGPGTAKPGSVVATQTSQQQPGEDRSDYMKRVFAERMNSAAQQGRRV